MEKHFNSFTIYFIKKLNEYSLFSLGDLKFISFIEENSINIKAFDDMSNCNYSSETKYLYLIDDIKKKTIFDYFHNNTWTELVENVQLNFYIRKQFKNNFTNIPSKKLIKLVMYSFKNIFETNISKIILQFLSTTSNNYLLYCISKWLEQEKINPDFILHYLDEEEQSLLKSFYNKENDIEMYLMNYNKVKFPLFLKNETKNENFMISNEPIYYKGSKIYSLASLYDGIGSYVILSVSLSEDNQLKPFFFRLDGGSNGYDRELNENYFKHFIPPKNKMLSLSEVFQIIQNNTFQQHLIIP